MEAQVAEILDILGWPWQYEPRVFRFPVRQGNVQYSPDFWVEGTPWGERWLEVKGYLDRDSLVKLTRFARYYPDEARRLLLLTDDKRRLQELLRRKPVQQALDQGMLVQSLRKFLKLGG